MTGSAPPRLAMSLLDRCFRRDDPLLGDLIEEYATGRSRLWFWRQSLAAVGVRGPLGVRVAGLATLAMLVIPTGGYVAYARAVTAELDLPRLVQRLTVEEMMRSVRTDDVYAPLRLHGQVVDVTGVLARVIPRSGVAPSAAPALFVTSAFDVPSFGAVFLLDPSVDVAALMPGDSVTLRCPVLEARVSQAFCVVLPA